MAWSTSHTSTRACIELQASIVPSLLVCLQAFAGRAVIAGSFNVPVETYLQYAATTWDEMVSKRGVRMDILHA